MCAEKEQQPLVIPMLEQRRIEAQIVKNIYDVLLEKYGEQQANETIETAIIKAAIEQGKNFRDSHGKEPTLEDFSELGKLWEMGGALKREMRKKTATHLEYDIVHCAYANMYKEMGLAKIGHLLSCNRDGTFCIGYNPKMRLVRTQTIMEGASHCDFRYEMVDENKIEEIPASS